MASKLAIVSSIVAASALSYFVYFDYQRRNSADFRKHLRLSAKKHARAQELAAENDKNELKTKVRELLTDSLRNDPLPEELKEQEKFFVEEVSRAEELLSKPGETAQVEAALAFYRALRVYPSPVDLLGLYDKSLKQPTLDLLRMMIVMEPPPALVSVLGQAAAGATAAAPDVE